MRAIGSEEANALLVVVRDDRLEASRARAVAMGVLDGCVIGTRKGAGVAPQMGYPINAGVAGVENERTGALVTPSGAIRPTGHRRQSTCLLSR